MSTSSFGTPASGKPRLDESTLRRLAVEPNRPLFPVLAQAAAMQPLILLIAIVPALYSASYAELDRATAWQGLAALNVVQADSLSALVDPAGGTALDGQPPLASWIGACFLRLFGSATLAAPVAVSVAGVAVLVLATSLLARRYGGERAALVAAGLMALNPVVLRHSQHAGPATLGGALAVLSVVGLVVHRQQVTARWSLPLWCAGGALGLCLLAAPLVPLGPVALAVCAALVGVEMRRRRKDRVLETSGSPGSFRPLRMPGAVWQFAVVALAVGGWWWVWKCRGTGASCWQQWLSVQPEDTSESSLADLQALAAHRLLGLWPISGLIFLGVTGLLDPARDEAGRGRSKCPELAVAGIGGSLLAILLFFRDRQGLSEGASAVQLLLIAFPVTCAALGFVRVIDRQASARQLILCATLTAAAGFGASFNHASQFLEGQAQVSASAARTALAGGTLILVWLVAGMWLLKSWGDRGDRLPRLVLIVGLGLTFGLSAVWGLQAIGRSKRLSTDLAEMRLGLSQVSARSVAILWLPEDGTRPPAEVEFLVRSRWPQLEIQRGARWENSGESLSLLSADHAPEDLVVMTWIESNTVRPEIPGNRLRALGPAYRYRRGELAAYSRRQDEPLP